MDADGNENLSTVTFTFAWRRKVPRTQRTITVAGSRRHRSKVATGSGVAVLSVSLTDGRVVRAQVLSDFGDKARQIFTTSEAVQLNLEDTGVTAWAWLATIALGLLSGVVMLRSARGGGDDDTDADVDSGAAGGGDCDSGGGAVIVENGTSKSKRFANTHRTSSMHLKKSRTIRFDDDEEDEDDDEAATPPTDLEEALARGVLIKSGNLRSSTSSREGNSSSDDGSGGNARSNDISATGIQETSCSDTGYAGVDSNGGSSSNVSGASAEDYSWDEAGVTHGGSSTTGTIPRIPQPHAYEEAATTPTAERRRTDVVLPPPVYRRKVGEELIPSYTLSEEQVAKVNELQRNIFAKIATLKGIGGGGGDGGGGDDVVRAANTQSSKEYCTLATLVRYLNARDWKV